MSFLRPILSDDAPPIEVLRAAEKQLMARLYFWLILRGAKAWIMPLDHGLLKPTLACSMTVSLSPPLSPTAQEPSQALLGEGAFPSFSHLIAYLLRMQNQPRRRERGVLPRSSASKYVSGIGRWRPTVSSPLRWTVVTGLYDEDEEDAREVAESLLETIDEEEESIMEEGSESWFDMLGELDDEDMGHEEDEEDEEIVEDMDEDDREWARLRFQMAMDIERRTWSGSDHDLDRSKMATLDRPGSPTPDSLAGGGCERRAERYAGDVELYEYVDDSTSKPTEQPPILTGVPHARPTANLQKRSLSDSDLVTDNAALAKRRRLSAVDLSDTTSSSGCTYDRCTKSRRRPAERKPRRSGSRMDTNNGRKLRRRVSGSSLGGSVAAL
ncbi:hypothetical protein BKA70DRAFT_1314435 [Coprinopsis sp. MPI-PUGE-AT-0042]|nr:hypothetical protein BKA70DRAFT_1314435 [Coprinopsis sp. MPI-PUGE-AT-0042]